METLDHATCYRAVRSRDRRFDGLFFTAVRTTGIYCRPSCPARTPAEHNVDFHPSAASAQGAGFRACKRCLPNATPGNPEWDLRADTAGRAMRLIADGVVDRDGVVGLARRLGYTPRHLTRVLTAELGAGPLALARSHRAQTARVLIETTTLGYADIAFAAGFSSVRQFNETIREVYAASPTELRGRRGGTAAPGRIAMRLAVRTPFAGRALHSFLSARAVPGVEEVGDGWYARTLLLPHAPGTVRVELPDLDGPEGTAQVRAWFRLGDVRDTGAAVERVRRLLDADCDPWAVTESLEPDPVLGPLRLRAPGLRVPGHVDGAEVAVRAVLGQQVTIAAARTLATRLVADLGDPLPEPDGGLTRLFPAPPALAGLDPERLAMPRARGRSLVALGAALASGTVAVDRGPDRAEVRAGLLALPGIGPWTADYIAMRALGDPDVFLATDVGTRQALARRDVPADRIPALAEGWRPWRSYAQVHLWHALTDTHAAPEEDPRCGP